jgi:uncharacterized protein
VDASLDRSAVAAAVRDHPDGATITVRVVVRSPRTVISGLHGDALKIRVAAPPVDGAANEELCGYVAGMLGLRASDVTLLSGDRSRDKVILAHGVDRDRAIGALLA